MRGQFPSFGLVMETGWLRQTPLVLFYHVSYVVNEKVVDLPQGRHGKTDNQWLLNAMHSYGSLFVTCGV